jgi:ATP-dependent exoDNAse (exonuclease V) alpha subunit
MQVANNYDREVSNGDLGVTRGKRLVVLVGQRRAMAIAVKNANGRRRWSKLREWLTPGLGMAQMQGS